MSIGLIAWGRFVVNTASGQSRVTVPAPPTDPGKPWLADMLHAQAAEIGSSFDFVQWPPWSKAQGGSGAGCDGYGIYDRRDLGTKPQQGSTPTRYGPLESTLAAIAALNAYGCRSLGDLVLHQLIGENSGPGKFRYLGADGKTLNGRGATSPGWFRGNTGNNDPVPPFCREDDVPVESADTPFGRELSYQNCQPAGITIADACDFAGWLVRRTGAVGFRYDDVKGTWTPAVARIMQSLPASAFLYSEYFDGDPQNLNGWATSSPMNSRSAVADFALHFRIQAACDQYDARLLNLDQTGSNAAGYYVWNPGLAVGFVDNPDTDTSEGQQVSFNKGLAYAYLLTIPVRMALVYGKDYFPSSVWPGAYGLKPLIDNLCWISRMFAFGACETRWLDNDVCVLSRDGNGGATGFSGGLLTALNFNTLSSRTITCSTPFGANRWLHDYTGHHGDIWTDGNGNATFTIPSNAFSEGRSYLCFSPGGVDQPFAAVARSTTQQVFGQPDLDVMPVRNGPQSLPQRLYCAKGHTLKATLNLHREGVPATASVEMDILGPDNVARARVSTGKASSGHAEGIATKTGWHTIRLTGTQLPSAGVPFSLEVNYMGAAGPA